MSVALLTSLGTLRRWESDSFYVRYLPRPQPVYETIGPFCYIKAFKNSVNFGFWRGIDIDDPNGLLQGTGVKMRHVKLTSLSDVDDAAFSDFVEQAVELNLKKGNPTKGV